MARSEEYGSCATERSHELIFSFFAFPVLLHSIGPAVVSLPAVDRMIDRGAFTRRVRTDSRQPFAICIPAFLLGVSAGSGSASWRVRCVLTVIERGAKGLRFLITHWRRRLIIFDLCVDKDYTATARIHRNYITNKRSFLRLNTNTYVRFYVMHIWQSRRFDSTERTDSDRQASFDPVE